MNIFRIKVSQKNVSFNFEIRFTGAEWLTSHEDMANENMNTMKNWREIAQGCISISASFIKIRLNICWIL